MSNVSNQHNVIPFVSGESKPLSGQRLARVLYKGKSALRSVCVSIPPIPAEVTADSRFVPYFVEYLESVQDKVIKGLYEARKGNLDRVSDSDISPDAMLAYLTAESAGQRISGESIGAWFDSYVRDNLTVIVCEKLGTEDLEDPRVHKSVEQFREILSLCAAKEIRLNDKQKHAISRMFDLASDGALDGFGAKLRDKYDAICGKAAEDMLDI